MRAIWQGMTQFNNHVGLLACVGRSSNGQPHHLVVLLSPWFNPSHGQVSDS